MENIDKEFEACPVCGSIPVYFPPEDKESPRKVENAIRQAQLYGGKRTKREGNISQKETKEASNKIVKERIISGAYFKEKEMKLTNIKDIENLQTIYRLSITHTEFAQVSFNDFDRLLIDECETSDRVSDKLLALEMIARRIESRIIY